MIVKKIQKNETVKFRVPQEVALELNEIKAECSKLDWRFSLENEIADAILKACRKAKKEILAEIAERGDSHQPRSSSPRKNKKGMDDEKKKALSAEPHHLALPLDIPADTE